MPAISAKPTLASHSPVECGAFFSPSRSVRLRFLRVRRLFCGNPPAPRRMCAHFSARKIELRTSRPRFLRACRLFCGNLPAPLFECASAFSGNRRIGRLQPHFLPACYAFSHFEADILHFAAKLSLLQQLTRPKAQNLTFISKTRPLKHRNVSESLLHKTPITAPFQCQNHPLNAKIEADTHFFGTFRSDVV